MRGTAARRRTVRPRRRRLAAQQLLEPAQRAGEGFRLDGRKARKERREARANRVPRRAQRGLARGCEGELLPPAVGGRPDPRDEPRALEGADQLGDRRRRDGGAARQVGADHLALGDCLEGQELAARERRLLRGEQPLHPAGRERSHPAECVGGFRGPWMWTRWNNS